MPMIDRLNQVLTPRFAGVINLILVAYGVFAPPLGVVITEQLTPTLTPLAILLTLCLLTWAGKWYWFKVTGQIPYEPTGTTADFQHTGFLLADGLSVATRLCAWMTLGAVALYLMIVLPGAQ